MYRNNIISQNSHFRSATPAVYEASQYMLASFYRTFFQGLLVYYAHSLQETAYLPHEGVVLLSSQPHTLSIKFIFSLLPLLDTTTPHVFGSSAPYHSRLLYL